MKTTVVTGKSGNILTMLFGRLGVRSKEGDEELPFTLMLVTLMASCGVSPYESFKRMRSTQVLPFTQKESREIVRQVEVLNKDPLTAMLHRADESGSVVYGDFLRGYVSTVRSGGSVTSYLKSKLRSVFDVQAAAAFRSIERLETLVEAYMVTLLVLLCVYILAAVMSSATFSSALNIQFGSPMLIYFIIFLAMPLMSILFMFAASQIRKGTLMGIGTIYRKAIPSAIGASALLASIAFVPQIRAIANSFGLPIFVTACLVAVSLFPMISYRRMIGLNLKAEEAMPSFLRDISEARKTGMSPEKSIVAGAQRKGYGSFSKILQQIVNQIEWGVSLRKIYDDVKDSIKSWPVITNFLILIETIEVGGGSSEALELLANYSEKLRDVEKNKRDMLKPYVILPFIWTILMALTFVFTFYIITQIPTLYLIESPYAAIEEQMGILSSAIIFHCWLSGFFIGKVTQGTFAAGFEYSVFFAALALASLMLSQRFITVFLGALV
jgi:flagellar protein FlaJ